MELDIVRCQTCGAGCTWPDDGTDGLAWAIRHSRETGCPDNYRLEKLPGTEVES